MNKGHIKSIRKGLGSF